MALPVGVSSLKVPNADACAPPSLEMNAAIVAPVSGLPSVALRRPKVKFWPAWFLIRLMSPRFPEPAEERKLTGFLVRGPLAKVISHSLDNVTPGSDRLLPVDAHGRIPRAALVPRGTWALRHPVPRARLRRVHQPHGLAHRAGEVRDRGVDGDDQVEVGNQRRGVVP